MAWSAGLVIHLGALYYVLMLLGPEVGQGFVQKIFFFHVPAAFVMYAALFLAAIFAGLYLSKKRDPHYDLLSRAFTETSLIFATIVIVSGPIWAKPIWGVYWTWDPRLTTTFIAFLLLIATLSVRKVFSDRRLESRGSVISAILVFLAVLDIPLVHFSVKLWRGIHPSVLKNPQGLPPEYSRGLEFMTLSLFILGGLIAYCLWKYHSLKQRILKNGNS